MGQPSDPNRPAAELFPAEALPEPGPASPVTGVEASALQAEAATPVLNDGSPNRRWAAGTLTYTSAGLISLFLILLAGDFALQMRERSVGTPVQYMLKRLHASDTLIAVAFSFLPPLLALIVVPVASFKSDRLRSRYGRRIPYLLVPAPLAAVAMVVISYSESIGAKLSGAGGVTPNQAALAIFTAAWVAYEVAVLIGNAILNALINDVVPRQLLGRFYGLFRAVSLIAGMIFNFWLIQYSETHYRAIFIGLAALFLFGFGAMCLGVKEGDYPPPEPVDPQDSAARRFADAIGIYFRECFSIPYYCWAFAGLSLAAVTLMPINLFSAIYAKTLGLTPGQYGYFIGVTYCISLAFAWPLGWLVDRAHALRVSIAMMGIYAVVMLVAYAFMNGQKSFGIALVIHGVLSGCYFTTSAPLAQTLFPRMKFAQFASAQGMLQSVLTMAMAVTIGPLLDYSDHNYRLTFLMGGILGAAAVIALLVTYSGFNRLGGMAGYVPPEVADERS